MSLRLLKPLKLFSFHLVIFSLIFNPAISLAQEVDPAAGTDIHVHEQNNTTIIDIEAANSSGLSHNRFDNYSAQERNHTLNNSAVDGVSVQAGDLDKNVNFNNGSDEASKILFEVLGSGNKSNLTKNIEIFGKKADFILANSKGITCSGCGFINTSDVSLVTGNVSNTSDVNNIQYEISEDKNSNILINDQGITFYGNNNDEIDFNLISRAVKIAGELKVQNAKLNNLNIRTGAGQYNSNTKSFTNNFQNNNPNNDVNEGTDDEGFAVVIDSTAVGGVRANQISIIATEEGAGVKTDKDLISDLGSVEITANGDIVVKKNITANDVLGNADQSVKLTANNNHSITIENGSNINAKKDIIFNADSNIANSGNLSAQNGNVDFVAANDITNSGLITGKDVSLLAKNITNNNQINSSYDLTITSTNLTNNSELVATNQITITASNNITNYDLIKAGIISLQAQNNITNSANSKIQSTSGNLTFNLNGTLTNNSQIIAKTDLIILGNSTFTNETAKIFTAGNAIKITAKKFTNNQNLDLKGGFLLLSDQANQGLFNNALITSSISDLEISGAMHNQTSGILQSAANKNIILNSLNADMINAGLIKTDEQLKISGSLINQNIIGRIDDSTPLNVTDKKYLKILVNKGSLINDENGQIITDNYLLIDGNNQNGNLINLGLIASNHFSDVNNFADDNAIEITNINVLTNEGVIDSNEDLVITANEIFNQNSALLFASNNAILNADKLTNDNAYIITSFGDILIQKEILTNSDGTKSFVKSSEVNNINNAQIKTLKTAIDAPLFNDADIARIVEQYAIEMLSTNNFSAEELTSRIYALRGFLKDSNLSIEEQVEQAISGNIKISTQNLTNDNNSIISSNNYIKIEADTVNNSNDSVLASATYFDIITNNLNNQNNAQIYGAAVLNIKAANEDDLNNQISNSGLIRGSSVYLNTARLVNNGNAISKIDSFFGKEFFADSYQFVNNKLFVVDGNNQFLVSINKEIAATTQNISHLTDFFAKLGIDLNDPVNGNIKLFGDDIYLSEFISTLLNEKTGNRYITFDGASDASQLSSFLNTTATQMNKLNIKFGAELTNEQRANLSDPFIAFKQTEIFIKDGQIFNTQVAGGVKETIYVPTIITPFETTIDEETNQIASKNASAIEARNELIINATNEVRNNAEIKAGTIIIETTNFVNEFADQVLTIDENGFPKYVSKTPKIEATNNIIITAKEDFNNIGAEIIAGNALFVDAKNINITTSQVNKQNSKHLFGNYYQLSDSVFNVAASSLSAGDIILRSENDTNIIGSSLTATNAIQIDAGNNLIIASAQDKTTNTLNLSENRKVAYLLSRRGLQLENNQVTNIASNLNAGNIYLNSGNKLSITNSNINTKDLIATSLGKITFRGNNSKTTGSLALINDWNVLKPSEEQMLKVMNDDPDNFNQNQILNLQNSVYEQQLAGQFGQNKKEKKFSSLLNASSNANTNAIDPNLNPPTGNPGDNINISSGANIVYEAGQGQHSTNDLILMTSADIINHGSLIADGNINLSAYNIINSKVATTQNHGHGFNTTLSGEALIKAGGDVLLQATNDINNYAGTIIAETGNITLLAGNNVNIGTMQERNFVHVGGKFQYHYDKTTNHGSEISAGNNIVIKAGNNSTTQNGDSGNINITGSNLTSGTNAAATEGNIYLNAANDVNITSSKDSLVTYGNARKSSFYQASTTNNESNLTAGQNSNQGSIYINTFNIDENNNGQISIPPSIAAKDISNNVNITGSNLTAKDDVYLTANNDITIESAQDTYQRIDRFKSKKRSSTTEINQTTQVSSDITAQGGNVVINSLNKDINVIASNLTAANNINLEAGNEVNILSAANIDYFYSKTSKKSSGGLKSKSSMNERREVTQVASNLLAYGDININAISDINITGSNLAAVNDGFLTSQIGNINIKNAIDSVMTHTKDKKRGSLSMRSDEVYDYQEYAAESSLIFGNNLNFDAEFGTALIQGSTLDVGNDLNFGTFTVATNPDGSLRTNANGTFETVSGSSVQNVTITSADLKHEHWEKHKSSSINPVKAVKAAYKQVGQLVTKTANKAMKKYIQAVDKVHDKNPVKIGFIENAREKSSDIIIDGLDKTRSDSDAKGDGFITIKKSESRLNETLQHASTIKVGGNLNINATNNVLIKGSNVDVTGNGMINAGGKVEFVSAQNLVSSKRKETEISIGSADIRFENNQLKAGVQGTGSEFKNVNNKTIQSSSNLTFENLLVNSQNDFNIVASNVFVNDSAIIRTGSSFNLLDAKNLENDKTETSTLEVEIGVKVGNAYVDLGTAAYALYEATEKLKEATSKFKKMEKLKDQGRASQKAVDLAMTAVVVATANVASATLSLTLSAQGAAAAASTSLGTGMYAAGYMDTTYHTDETKTNISQSVASSLIVNNDLSIIADKQFNQTGSFITSNNGNINLSAKEFNIKAGENSFQNEFSSKTVNAGVSVGNNGVGVNAGYNQADSYILSTSYINSKITANNGTLTLNSTKDLSNNLNGNLNIIGGNLSANNVNLNIAGNLTLETLQDTYEEQGSSFGISGGYTFGGGDTGTSGTAKGGVDNSTLSFSIKDIYSKTTKEKSGIIELSTYDNDQNQDQNLNNFLNKNNNPSAAGGSVNIAGSITNNTVKEDLTFINADSEMSLTVPTLIFTESGRATIAKSFKNFGTNVKTAGYGAANTLRNSFETLSGAINNTNEAGIVDTFKAKQTEQVIALQRGQNPLIRKNTNNLSEGKSAEQIQDILNTGIEDKNKDGKSNDGNKLYSDQNDLNALGFSDKDSKQGYINASANATNTTLLLFTDGHERGHETTSNENFANMVGSEATQAWNAVNWIYGDSINTSGNFTQEQWNQNYNSSNNYLLNQNSYQASLVAQQNRDYLTIFVHGTNSSPSQADPEFLKALEKTFGEKALQPDWSSKKLFTTNNNKESREIGAEKVLKIVENHQFEEGEKLNIIDHSHGGNVVKLFTQLYDGDKKIDTLVFLGTPHREDYQLDYYDLSENSNLINIYDRSDWLVQPILGSGLSGSLAKQTLQGATNIGIKQTETITNWDWRTGQITNTQVGAGWLDSHSNLDSKPIWDAHVKPNLKK